MEKLIKRNSTIDAFRVFAIFGVIAIHVQSNTDSAEMVGRLFAGFRVPYFYIVSLFYLIIGLKKRKDDDVNNIVNKIFYRLVVPYLAWTIIYVSLRLIKAAFFGEPSNVVFWRVLFYGDGAVQLYFIPNLLSMQAIIISIYLLLKGKLKNKLWAIVILSCVVVFLTIGILKNSFAISTGFIFVGIPLFISLAFSATFFNANERNAVNIYMGSLIIVVTTIFNIIPFSFSFFGYNYISPFMAFGILILCIGLFDQFRLPSALTSATFGIYLSHVLFLEIFEFIISQGHIILYYDLTVKLLVTFFIFLFSLTGVFIMRKSRILRFYLLGEKATDSEKVTSDLDYIVSCCRKIQYLAVPKKNQKN
ncbi:acyltransferase family protein [Flavobacterium sp. ST-87]|uniref:Acyltransferase family protein n=1 Tax=Flavobacterium plantiphilum TaxID=3163297 RepID=A0ABW8XXE4_9FLAO